MSLPLVAVIGRPNVGKSTLINRVALKRTTITHKIPGVTRDRKYVEVEYNDKDFVLIDTGGFQFEKDESFGTMIADQAKVAIKEAQSIIFVVDVKEGLNPYDEEIANLLRKSGVKTYLAVNKVDNKARQGDVGEFYKLGFEELYGISAAHGIGIGKLFDKVSSGLPEAKTLKTDERPTVAIVGRPNAGKSLLLNRLLGQDRVIVSDVPGTTRDAVDSIVSFEGKEYRFIDTAGIKRKRAENIEYYGVVRTLEILDRADIALVMIDASEAITEQDQRILDYTLARGNALIILLNKWDIVNEEQNKKLKRDTWRKLHFVTFAPMLDISAKTGRGVKKIFKQLAIAESEHAKKIKTAELNSFIRGIDIGRFPSKTKIRIGYGSQVSVKPPEFVFFINTLNFNRAAFKRFLENNLRQTFGFIATPVKIIFKSGRQNG